MSLQSKIVLLSASVFSLGIIGYVHYKQYIDRDLMHAGVVKDIERRQKRKAENIYVLQQQIDLTRELRTQSKEDGVR